MGQVATEMSTLVSMLFRTFLDPLKFLMEILVCVGVCVCVCVCVCVFVLLVSCIVCIGQANNQEKRENEDRSTGKEDDRCAY